ncbi:N-acetyltransferase [Planoprotostelium fungivorum]|uniref:N-acetyltransferase n=1 Tax=Planoprotostelium fungivorum TaxID=1890364 RepID=A0A2P6MW90_9EUKA|nr:N-acetyltransferase [Planoprotostelium fungivorum]
MGLRQAIEEDIPAVMVLVRSVVPLMNASGNFQWTETYPSEERFREDASHGHLWVSTEDEVILGCASIIPRAFEPDYKDANWDISQPYVVVHRLAVSPAARGKGIAAALLTQAEVVARTEGLEYVRMDTNTQNKATQQLFPKLGYRFTGEIGLRHRPGLRFVCFEKKIQS